MQPDSDSSGLLRRTLVVAAMAMMLHLGGCNSGRTTDRDLVLVSPSEATELTAGVRSGLSLKAPKPGVYVDPRTRKAFLAGRVPGAVHLPYREVNERHRELNQYSVLIVYGDTWNDPLAHGLSKKLIELGHDNVRTIRGGLEAWADAGMPIEIGEPATVSAAP